MESYTSLLSSSAAPVQNNISDELLNMDDDHNYMAGLQMELPRSEGMTKLVDDQMMIMNKDKDKEKENKKNKSRKPKYAFQTRSQVDILDDGYRWRKYGQKAVKNNKFPRSYYRCTHEGCNVKKQIQRLSKDEGIVVTTYEGMHSHPIQKSTDNFEHILTQMHIYNATQF